MAVPAPAPATPKEQPKIKKADTGTLRIAALVVTRRGVRVSNSPRNTPLAAKTDNMAMSPGADTVK